MNPRIRYLAQRAEVRIRAVARTGRRGLPVLLDVAGYVLVVVGVAKLWGEVAWLAAGVLLILSGLRAQS